jgi:hypothetical protein
MNRSGGTKTEESPAAAISAFDVERPNLVVHGTGLYRVEVYAVPTGTNITEASIQKVGEARFSQFDKKGQVWTLTIPKDPILATDIYAIGYDALDKPVGTVSLGIIGATDIHEALWGSGKIVKGSATTSPTDKEVNMLKAGDSATFNGLKVTLKSVDSDSRCPEKVQCIQAGSVGATLELNLNGTVSVQKFDSMKPLVYQGYTITAENIEPKATQGEKNLGSYRITFRISQS